MARRHSTESSSARQTDKRIEHQIVLPPQRHHAVRRFHSRKGLAPEHASAIGELAGVDVEAAFQTADHAIAVVQLEIDQQPELAAAETAIGELDLAVARLVGGVSEAVVQYSIENGIFGVARQRHRQRGCSDKSFHGQSTPVY